MLIRRHHVGFFAETVRQLLIFVAPLILNGVSVSGLH